MCASGNELVKGYAEPWVSKAPRVLPNNGGLRSKAAAAICSICWARSRSFRDFRRRPSCPVRGPEEGGSSFWYKKTPVQGLRNRQDGSVEATLQ